MANNKGEVKAIVGLHAYINHSSFQGKGRIKEHSLTSSPQPGDLVSCNILLNIFFKSL